MILLQTLSINYLLLTAFPLNLQSPPIKLPQYSQRAPVFFKSENDWKS